jgi:hypothetical protein
MIGYPNKLLNPLHMNVIHILESSQLSRIVFATLPLINRHLGRRVL